jgi:hypothetical protein
LDLGQVVAIQLRRRELDDRARPLVEVDGVGLADDDVVARRGRQLRRQDLGSIEIAAAQVDRQDDDRGSNHATYHCGT